MPTTYKYPKREAGEIVHGRNEPASLRETDRQTDRQTEGRKEEGMEGGQRNC